MVTRELNDCYYFDLDKNMWKEINNKTVFKSNKQISTNYKEQIYNLDSSRGDLTTEISPPQSPW